MPAMPSFLLHLLIRKATEPVAIAVTVVLQELAVPLSIDQRMCRVQRILVLPRHLHLVLVQLHKQPRMLFQHTRSKRLILLHLGQERITRVLARLAGAPVRRPVRQAAGAQERHAARVRQRLGRAAHRLAEREGARVADQRRREHVDVDGHDADVGRQAALQLHQHPRHQQVLAELGAARARGVEAVVHERREEVLGGRGVARVDVLRRDAQRLHELVGGSAVRGGHAHGDARHVGAEEVLEVVVQECDYDVGCRVHERLAQRECCRFGARAGIGSGRFGEADGACGRMLSAGSSVPMMGDRSVPGAWDSPTAETILPILLAYRCAAWSGLRK